jgi:hypothetical protein
LDLVTHQNVTATQHLCELTFMQGMLNMGGLLACTVMMVAFWQYLARAGTDMDEEVQSAQVCMLTTLLRAWH